MNIALNWAYKDTFHYFSTVFLSLLSYTFMELPERLWKNPAWRSLEVAHFPTEKLITRYFSVNGENSEYFWSF